MTRNPNTRSLLPAAIVLAALVASSCDRHARTAGREQGASGPVTVKGIPDFPGEVTLQDGYWEGEPFIAGGATRPGLVLDASTMASADLDGDGEFESVAVITATTGGSGSYYYLVAFRPRDGGLESVATLFLGDRIKIMDLVVGDETVRLDLVEHGDGDPMCCPTRSVSRQYSLVGGELVPAAQDGRAEVERLWGYIVWAHESRQFESCDGSRRAWLLDSVTETAIGDLYREFATDDYAPVFFDVAARRVDMPDAAFAADYTEAIEIVDVLRVEREGFGCRLDVDGLLFRAFGNEPAWRLDLREDGAKLSSMTLDGDNLEIPGRVRYEEQGVAFESADAGLSAHVLKQPCRDTMSGTYFSHTVEIRHGDRRLSGCGVPGR